MVTRIERSKRRYSFQLPVVVSATPNNAGPRGITRDVSENGIFFYAESWNTYIRQFEFRILMPSEITGIDIRRALCRATVVRVEDAGAKTGVAARIEEIIWM